MTHTATAHTAAAATRTTSTSGETRAQRIYRLLAKGHAQGLSVFHTAQGAATHVRLVTSSTEAKRLYVVRPLDVARGCDCDGYQKFGMCKHYALTLEALGWLPDIEDPARGPRRTSGGLKVSSAAPAPKARGADALNGTAAGHRYQGAARAPKRAWSADELAHSVELQAVAGIHPAAAAECMGADGEYDSVSDVRCHKCGVNLATNGHVCDECYTEDDLDLLRCIDCGAECDTHGSALCDLCMEQHAAAWR